MNGKRILAVVAILVAHPVWAADPPFAEFPAGPLARGPSMPLDLSDPGAKAFRTRLREGVRGPANYAGHYSLIRWGCGTSCAASAVVDRLNGHVIMLPSVCCTEHFTDDFEPIVAHADSRLIVMSGKINEDGPDVVHYFDVSDGRVREVRSVPFPSAATPVPSADQDGGNKATAADCKSISLGVARLNCYDKASGR